MRLLVLIPFNGESQEAERCRSVLRPDTDVVVETIDVDAYPLNYVTYAAYRHAAADGVIRRSLRAEREGFDALFIACCYDPGLVEAREVLDIPVVGAFEAGVHAANLIAQRYSVIATEDKTVHCYRELADLYGTAGKLASVRHIGLSAALSYPELTDPAVIVERTLEVARRCVADDGAEAIVMGCTLQSCPLTVSGVGDANGVPIIDPVLAGARLAEFQADARRLGQPWISRFGTWQRPPRHEVARLFPEAGQPAPGGDRP